MKKMLLHVCCAPCLLVLLDGLKKYDVTLFFYNPNIMDQKEYQKRLQAVKKIADIYDLTLIVENYDNEVFLEKVKNFVAEKEGGRRCFICYELRLIKMLDYLDDYDFFATTLVSSPYKNKDKIDQIGAKLDSKYQVLNVKKENIDYAFMQTRKHDIYRQKYCGCIYSQKTKKTAV